MAFNKIIIFNNDEKVIFQGSVCNLPIKEEVIEDLCQEVYGNEKTCVIRRETIKGSIYIEIDNFIDQIYLCKNLSDGFYCFNNDIVDKLDLNYNSNSLMFKIINE